MSHNINLMGIAYKLHMVISKNWSWKCNSSVLFVGPSSVQRTSVHSRINYKITLKTYSLWLFVIELLYCNSIEELELLTA